MIYCDFDGTLAVSCLLDDAFSRFVPWTDPAADVATQFAQRREQRAEYDSLNKGEKVQLWLSKGAVTVEYVNDPFTYVAFARPHAKEFLKACADIAPTHIFTAGRASHQQKIARRLCLQYDKLYGREDYGSIPPHPKNLLVDDLGHMTEGVQRKLQALGFGRETPCPADRFIYVPPWDGKDSNDRTLVDILPRIAELQR